jgi:hypothetical protein
VESTTKWQAQQSSPQISVGILQLTTFHLRKLTKSGNFSFIPREIRDRVYAYALDFNNYMKGVPLCHKHKPESPGASLLRVSKAIHAESIVALYQVNEFAIWISYDPLGRENGNHSIMNRPGFVMGFGHNDGGMGKPLIATIFKLPHGMAKYLQRVHLQVGTLEGIMERDISHVHRCISGPERPTYRSLIQVVEDACDLLKRPDKCKYTSHSSHSRYPHASSTLNTLKKILRRKSGSTSS